ncbi:hypothetical protein MTO96_008796 [Rhipicephalus appendiculatus]
MAVECSELPLRRYLLNFVLFVADFIQASVRPSSKMLYLEDYLENAMDSLDERVKQFFANARKMKPEQRDMDFDKIRKVDRYLRRLDQELQKFKMELEADNAGITEVLERQRKHVATSLGGSSMSSSGQPPEKRQATERVLPLAGEVSSGRPVAAAVGAAAGTAALAPADRLLIPPSALTYGLGSNAIAAAASQAIAATQQCPFEWFHYQCVGITQPPKGKWFCPQCTSAMKRRGRKDR